MFGGGALLAFVSGTSITSSRFLLNEKGSDVGLRQDHGGVQVPFTAHTRIQAHEASGWTRTSSVTLCLSPLDALLHR